VTLLQVALVPNASLFGRALQRNLSDCEVQRAAYSPVLLNHQSLFEQGTDFLSPGQLWCASREHLAYLVFRVGDRATSPFDIGRVHQARNLYALHPVINVA
jgi:hypothetical protein